MKNLAYLINQYAYTLPKAKDGRAYMTVITCPDDCGGNCLYLAIGARFRHGERKLPRGYRILSEFPVTDLPKHLGDEFPKTTYGHRGVWDMRQLCLVVLEKILGLPPHYKMYRIPFLKGFYRTYEEIWG